MRPAIQCRLVNDPFGDPGVHADLMFERSAFLFDLGDLRALPTRMLMRVGMAFVSHAHMDHFAGFDTLLRLLLGREATLRLFGPAGFIDQVEHKLRAYTWNIIRTYATTLTIEVTEVVDAARLRRARFVSAETFAREDLPEAACDDGLLVATGALRMRCAVLDHGTPCLGFALEETAHVNVWRTRLDARGLAVGPWLRDLKHAVLRGAPDDLPVAAPRRDGPPVALTLGELRDIVAVVPGQRIAYVTDLRFTEANAAAVEWLARDADLLFIESPFLHADADQAARRNHLTAHQAGSLARRAGAKRIEPFHFSPRYDGRGDELRAEAERAFRGSV